MASVLVLMAGFLVLGGAIVLMAWTLAEAGIVVLAAWRRWRAEVDEPFDVDLS